MKLRAIGFNLTRNDRDQINIIFKGCGIDGIPGLIITAVHDVKTTKLADMITSPDTILVTFGNWAHNMCKKIAKDRGYTLVSVPDVKRLYKSELGGNPKDRENAFSALKSLKSAIESGKLRILEDKKLVDSIKLDGLKNFNIEILQKLEAAVENSGRTDWVLRSGDQNIRVSLYPSQDENYDVNITFMELIALRAAMDIFQADEVQFVPTINKSNKIPST